MQPAFDVLLLTTSAPLLNQSNSISADHQCIAANLKCIAECATANCKCIAANHFKGVSHCGKPNQRLFRHTYNRLLRKLYHRIYCGDCATGEHARQLKTFPKYICSLLHVLPDVPLIRSDSPTIHSPDVIFHTYFRFSSVIKRAPPLLHPQPLSIPTRQSW